MFKKSKKINGMFPTKKNGNRKKKSIQALSPLPVAHRVKIQKKLETLEVTSCFGNTFII